MFFGVVVPMVVPMAVLVAMLVGMMVVIDMSMRLVGRGMRERGRVHEWISVKSRGRMSRGEGRVARE